MKNIISVVKSAPKRFIALVALLAAITVPFAVNAWGPSRTTYTIEKPASSITFNSITNNPNIGDERNFVGIREKGSTGAWSDNVEVKQGKEYDIRLYVHNNAASNLNLVARDVTAMFNLPTTTGMSLEVNGFLNSSNADYKQIWDNAKFYNSSEVFNVAYIAGSARYYNNYYGASGVQISDSVMTNSGALLGYDSLNGRIPGCFQYAGYLTITVKPQFANDFTIEKTVRKDGQTGTDSWKDSITASAGDKINYQIYYKNTSGASQKDVMIKDTLPAGGKVSYKNGTTMLYNSDYPNGKVMPDGITGQGINIGNYAAGANAYIRFTAEIVSADKLDCNDNILTNYAEAYLASNTQGTRKDSAVVTVKKDCDTPTYICSALNTKKLSRTKFQFSTNHSSTSGATYKSTTYVVREDKSYLPLEVARQTITSGDFIFETTKVGKYTVEAIITFTVNGKDETTSIGNCKTSFEVTEEGKEEEPKPEYCIIPGKEHLPAGHKDCSYPKAGPAGIIGSIIGLGSLTSSAAYYVISRRKI